MFRAVRDDSSHLLFRFVGLDGEGWSLMHTQTMRPHACRVCVRVRGREFGGGVQKLGRDCVIVC
jgi:hypothetical protein